MGKIDDLLDELPDRPLDLDELYDLQDSDDYDSVLTSDLPRGQDALFVTISDLEYVLHYTESEGWHKSDVLEKD